MKSKVIIEIAGSPKEHVEEVMKELVKKIQEEKKVLRYKIFEAQEREKMFFTFTELDVDFASFEELFGFCLDYMPSSVEMLEDDFNVKRDEMENVVNDLLAKLHSYDMTLKNLRAEIELLKRR